MREAYGKGENVVFWLGMHDFQISIELLWMGSKVKHGEELVVAVGSISTLLHIQDGLEVPTDVQRSLKDSKRNCTSPLLQVYPLSNTRLVVVDII